MSDPCRWPEVRRETPCPICGRADRCKRSPDGQRALCFRQEAGSYRPARNSVAWLHRLDGQPRQRTVIPRQDAEPDRADDATLARVYPALLVGLPLHARHRAQLRDRGLSDEAIDRNGYATLPEEPQRWRLAAELVERFGAEALRVPGVIRRESRRTGRAYVTIAGGPGLLVPCRSLDGQVLGLKLRLDRPTGERKYLLLSAMGGPRNVARVHAPVGTPSRCDQAVVTEGELKADVARHLADWTVLSIPGVDVWRAVLPVLQALGAGEVLVAYDADFVVNPAVRSALVAFLRGLMDAGHRAGVLAWSPEHGKGVDDALAGGWAEDIHRVWHRAEEVAS